MKKLMLFIIVSLNNTILSLACGYYPMGEDIRFSLFYPKYFRYSGFSNFNYNSHLFGFSDSDNTEADYTDKDENIEDWFRFTGKKIPMDDISQAIYDLSIGEITEDSDNQFLKYLYSTGQSNVINYIITAKSIEDINSTYYDDDPWERNHANIIIDRNKYLKSISKKCNEESNEYLKRRYAFLMIRLAYYSGEKEIISNYFKDYFEKKPKDFLYYWSLYFYSFVENSSTNIPAVFAHSPEKRYACYYYFHKDFNLRAALKHAKSKDEIANAYIFASVQKLDKNVTALKTIYKYQPKNQSLDFLLLREINKLEDWIYTPYYTNYLPSIEESAWENRPVVTTNILRARSERDRQYARKLLKFVRTVNLKKVNDPLLWQASKIQLLFMSKKYVACIKHINAFIKKYPNEKICKELEQIKALSYLANQKHGEAIIPEITKPIIEKNLSDKRFIFAAGRELEFLGNLPDAIALISNIDPDEDYNYDLVWQGNRLRNSEKMEYFTNTFSYLDFVYSAAELQKVVNKLEKTSNSRFEKVVFYKLLKNKDYIKDLLGTKYIREDKLQKALATFKSIGKSYWNNNYNAWERDKYDGGSYSFDENPFFDLKYTDKFIDNIEPFKVTKLSVTEHLIKYLTIAENPASKERDYYYFIIANCYYNMSQHGNTWMMRRYNSSSNVRNWEWYIDESEYRNNKKAQLYYLEAFKQSKSPEFKALCLRMSEYAVTGTRNFKKLKTEYPQYYEDLSQCYNLTKYFNARQKIK